MWASRLWADRFWAPRYWAKHGAEILPSTTAPRFVAVERELSFTAQERTLAFTAQSRREDL